MAVLSRAFSRAHSVLGTQAVLAAAALGSGAALVVAIVARTSLALTLAFFVTLGGVTVALWCLRVPAAARAEAGRRAAFGVLAGVAATVTYDLVRLAVVEVLRLRVHPYDTFYLFGELITGSAGAVDWVVGTAYHYLNGILFAVAYSLLLSGRHWRFGVAWGLGLESLMLLVYPAWLNIHLLLLEFTVMSVAGHVGYGTTLGVLCQGRRRGWRAPPRRVVR
jgi:hypothetical protein